MSVGGTVDAELEKKNGVGGTGCDGRGNFIHLVSSVVVREIAMAADVERRDMRAGVRKMEHSVFRLTAQIESGQPIKPALQRVTAAGSAKEKRAVVIAARFVLRVDIESAGGLRNVLGDQKYVADMSGNVQPMSLFLADDTPAALVGWKRSRCRLYVMSDDPDLLFRPWMV